VFERELTLYKFNLNYLRLLAADLDESKMGVAPFPGIWPSPPTTPLECWDWKPPVRNRGTRSLRLAASRRN
jgi:hypothetical protein